MKSIIFASFLLLNGLTAFAAHTVNANCQVQRIELDNMDWGAPNARVHLDCHSHYSNETYLDFHYTDKNLESSILKELHVGEILDLEITLNQSLMYTYPDMVTAIHSSSGFNTVLTYQDELMFVQR